MKVLGFGSIVWDDVGDDDEKVPTDSVAGERNIGGAVFNVIAHLKKLGCSSYMVSAVGNDKLGIKTIIEVKKFGIYTDFINKVKESTSVIHVTFDKNGFPHYTIPEIASWDKIQLSKQQLDRITKINFDFFIFGTIEQRNIISRETLYYILENVHFKNVFIDLTLRGNYYNKDILDYSMRKSNIVKMNYDEALVVNDLFNLKSKNYRDLIPLIANKFDSNIVCITLGSNGACIGDKHSIVCKPGYNIKVKDTVGSGDAFSAGLIYKLGSGASIEEACDFGNKMGALISSKISSIPDYNISEINRIQ
ncbi:MAG: PfkB family carbohydrate kinase [Promethearchaeota archaeon]